MSSNRQPGLEAPAQSFVSQLCLLLCGISLKINPYVLDLQNKFQLPKAPPREGEAWRERAVALEKQLEELQVKYDSEHIGKSCLGGDFLATDERDRRKEEEPKKKGARPVESAAAPQAIAHPKVVLRSILDPSQIDIVLPALPSTTHVLRAFETLDRLLFLQSSNSSSGNDLPNLLLATTKRAIDALGDNLARLLPPNAVSPSAADALDALGTLAERLIITVLPLFKVGPDRKQKRKAGALAPEWNYAALDEILGRIATVLLLPLVRSFAPLSTSFLSALLLAPNSKKRGRKSAAETRASGVSGQSDVRPDVFAMLDRIVTTLESLSASALVGAAPIVRRIKHVVVFEAARELLDLYTDSRPAGADTSTHAANRSQYNNSASSGSRETRAAKEKATATAKTHRAGRVGRLARKDALWYLCNALQRVLPLGVQPRMSTYASPTAGGEQEQAELLEETLYGMLARLLRTPPPSHAQPRPRARIPIHAGAHCPAPPGEEEGAKEPDAEASAEALAGTPGRHGEHEPSPGRPRYERATALGEVERGMVLAVVERAWLGLGG
ncbi:uncharacterized protein B0H18DRAFT_956678 [Fomitopsis serialis]|uniref:uncharacterized protein n=1 Tax=Fomitopsis serialis TaxID=139415 RepID=UPI002007BD95|nr:uncharacterized protein B0H18DRAFT_956678 [Neoantrodia serialis]KAH9921304.1 hypothetical protein B0H18DRAFT_956678 [Neoantrodia serialis]